MDCIPFEPPTDSMCARLSWWKNKAYDLAEWTGCSLRGPCEDLSADVQVVYWREVAVGLAPRAYYWGSESVDLHLKAINEEKEEYNDAKKRDKEVCSS